MYEWVISSTALTVIIIALRFILKGRISPRLQYALWALVLLRLVIPVSFGATGLSIGNLSQIALETETAQKVSDLTQLELPRMTYDAAYSEVAKEYAEQGVDISKMPAEEYRAVDDEILSRMGGGWTAREIIGAVWIFGIAAMGAALLASNIRLAARLRKSRQRVEGRNDPLPVYISSEVETPCLFGLLRPAVYITPEAAADGTILRHVVAHELTHFRHGDHIWSLLRGVCLALHWYNPVVWRAAFLSRDDSELACDEATIRRIGESQRAEYGRTLIGMTCQKRPDLLRLATTMTGSKGSIKERIMFIAKRPKTAIYTLAAVLLVAAVAAGCTFTGANHAEEQPLSGNDVTDWDAADREKWQSEVILDGFTVQASGSYAEIGQQWAEAYAAQYLSTSQDNPYYSRDYAVLSCEPYAESLLTTPKTLIFTMRFVCLAVDAHRFEYLTSGWAGPLSDEEYPQYEGWMELGWFVVLEQTGQEQWTCRGAGTGGFGGWGYLNYEYEEAEIIDFMMEQMLSAGEDTPENLMRALPFIDWAAFEEAWGAEGRNALWQTLDGICLTEGQVYGPEDTRMWSDVYPDDQAYRNLYVMLAALNADGVYAGGFADILRRQRAYDPEVFDACLQTLTQEQRGTIQTLVGTD